jgi:signal transduction histidine kinase
VQGGSARFASTFAVRAAVGAPLVVDGRLWGVAIAAWSGDEPPAAGAELRLERLAELLETAIASADSRDQLTAVRARLLAHGDEVRRGVLRDLHDGAQQRLVHTMITLKLARQALQAGDSQAESLLDEALEHAQQAHAELRELVHGILPAALTHGGVRSGVEALVRRLDLPVELDLPDQRLPAEIEAAVYFIAAEALTNVVKHAHAKHAAVTASVRDRDLQIEVRDDGMGGADPNGRGLVGIGDRLIALDGRLTIESPPGGGTLVTATLPL